MLHLQLFEITSKEREALQGLKVANDLQLSQREKEITWDMSDYMGVFYHLDENLSEAPTVIKSRAGASGETMQAGLNFPFK